MPSRHLQGSTAQCVISLLPVTPCGTAWEGARLQSDIKPEKGHVRESLRKIERTS